MAENASGYSIIPQPYPDYIPLLQDMESGYVHMAWLPPLTYVWARSEGFARTALLSRHYGVYGFGTQFLANASSGLISYFDQASGENTTDSAGALAQLAGKRPCWVSNSSPSGFITPAGMLAENNIPVEEGAFLLDHPSVVRALYIRGICDFGATFAIAGDPRTSTQLMDLPDVTDHIRVIWRSESIIPNESLAMLPEIPEEMRLKLINAFVILSKTEEGQKALTDTFGYEIEELTPVEESTFDRLDYYLQLSKVDPASLIGK